METHDDSNQAELWQHDIPDACLALIKVDDFQNITNQKQIYSHISMLSLSEGMPRHISQPVNARSSSRTKGYLI